MDGWIKLYRKLVDWEWYSDSDTKDVFIHLLLTANHTDSKWRGQEVKKGSVITSLESLASPLGISIQRVRTALNHLQKTGEIEKISTNKNTKIIVVNYSLYQSLMDFKQQAVNIQPTNNQQSTNNQLTTNKNVKNDKNEKNVRIESNALAKKSYGVYSNVHLTDSECQTLDKDFGNTEQLIKRLDEYKEQTGKKYKSDYLAIRRWVVKAVKEDETKEQGIDTTYDISDINNRAMLNDEFDI